MNFQIRCIQGLLFRKINLQFLLWHLFKMNALFNPIGISRIVNTSLGVQYFSLHVQSYWSSNRRSITKIFLKLEFPQVLRLQFECTELLHGIFNLFCKSNSISLGRWAMDLKWKIPIFESSLRRLVYVVFSENDLPTRMLPKLLSDIKCKRTVKLYYFITRLYM